MASIKDAGPGPYCRESYDRLSAAFRDTLEMGYSVSGFKDGGIKNKGEKNHDDVSEF